MINIPFILTLYSGFTHALEADHLLAVSNMVTTRNRIIKAVKDGMFWGLGHTSTIFLAGLFVLILKWNIVPHIFSYFEVAVGAMLIILGVYRLYQWIKQKNPGLHSHVHTHANGQTHRHVHLHHNTRTHHEHSHLPAYLVGLVHGLAGSGALMLVVMSQSTSIGHGLCFLLLFGFGSVAGMMVAAALFSLPFSKKIISHRGIQTGLILLSSSLCIVFGIVVIYKQLML